MIRKFFYENLAISFKKLVSLYRFSDFLKKNLSKAREFLEKLYYVWSDTNYWSVYKEKVPRGILLKTWPKQAQYDPTVSQQ